MMDSTQITLLRSKLAADKYQQRYGVLRAISGSMRYRIMVLLYLKKSGLTLSEMAIILNASLSRLSHQVKILRKNKIVVAYHEKKRIVYRLQYHYLLKLLV